MSEEIANLDYSDEDYVNDVLAKYEKKKSELDDQMKEWEIATESLMELEN